MKYYYSKFDINKLTTGYLFPQCQDYTPGNSCDIIERLYWAERERNASKYPEADVIVDGLKLHGHAKFSDVLSCAMIDDPQLLVSEKFLEIITKYNLPKHNIHKVYVYGRKGEKREYNIFYRTEINEIVQFVDLENSVFKTTQGLPTLYKDPVLSEIFKCNSFSEFMKRRERPPKGLEASDFFHVDCIELYLRNLSESGYDMINLEDLTSESMYGYLYSEPLVNELLENNITGLKFFPASKFIVSD